MGFGYSINDQQHGAAYFGELEEALMQRVDGVEGDGDTKCRHSLSLSLSFLVVTFSAALTTYQKCFHTGITGFALSTTMMACNSETKLV